MSPASKEEYAELAICKTKIGNIEEYIKELKQEVADLRKEKKENKERISDRLLAIYLTIATLGGGLVGGIALGIVQKALGL